MAKRINLALQGGGAHGAYTWGVLDRILDEDDIEVAAISGTSAGALNGAAFKAGYARDGREGARSDLDTLWRQMGALSDLRIPSWMMSPLAWPSATMLSRAVEYSLPYSLADSWARVVSPYAYGPFYQNPVEGVLRRIDFDAVRAEGGPDLFICATKVRDGKIRVFHKEEVTRDVVLASACLPTLFKAVEFVDPKTGRMEAFWDGGFTGNPALFPLFDQALPEDIVIVNINPLERDTIPVTTQQIQNRINEISFNSSLLRELRAINFVQRLIQTGNIPEGAMKKVLVHMISDDTLMQQLSVATKTVPNAALLYQLKAAGRAAAEAFLEAHRDDLNERSTVDLPTMFA